VQATRPASTVVAFRAVNSCEEIFYFTISINFTYHSSVISFGKTDVKFMVPDRKSTYALGPYLEISID
jgi:hypothetical protein